MTSAKLKDCILMELDTAPDKRGNITFALLDKHIPFEIKRIYYISDVSAGSSRGFHAHKKEKQVLIAINGMLKVTLDDGHERKTFELNDRTKALYVAPGIWREFTDFSSDSILLSIVDDFLDESEYIRDYDTFKSEVER